MVYHWIMERPVNEVDLKKKFYSKKLVIIER